MAKKTNTITYKWIISSMDSQLVEGSLTDVVITVHWRRSGQTADYNPTVTPEVGYYADVYGALTLPGPVDPETFIPYADLTESYVETTWLDKMTDPTVSEMDAQLAENLALQQNPVDATLPLPWAE
tara:strand:- start:31 stop:408 length:378 start_codon:yes stop_codon:yes gene_type:complete